VKSLQQTALVTGASSGIGAEIARKLSREGYDILLLGRDLNKLKSVQALLTGQSEICAFDLSHFKQHQNLILEKLLLLPPLSILVNNAGIFHRALFEETSDEVWMQQFQVNLLAAVQMTRLIWPFFKEQRKGSVLNIASTLGVKPSEMTSAYSAIKAAMINWTLTLAQEGGKFNIRANCLCPGIVDTPIHSFHHLPLEEKNKILTQMSDLQLLSLIGTPANIAEAAYFLSSDLSQWTTGSILHIDGGINIK
jgi:NAD(P)-dependent dehydrogenase (short-subunit alcohol dehydrogenase family)